MVCTLPSDYYISAHWYYRFSDVQFSSDIADVQCSMCESALLITSKSWSMVGLKTGTLLKVCNSQMWWHRKMFHVSTIQCDDDDTDNNNDNNVTILNIQSTAKLAQTRETTQFKQSVIKNEWITDTIAYLWSVQPSIINRWLTITSRTHASAKVNRKNTAGHNQQSVALLMFSLQTMPHASCIKLVTANLN